MKVLVIGGGIGGPAAASFLERQGCEVTLVERAPEFKHIGFGITLWSNGRAILDKLGIDEIVAAEAYEIPWIELADERGRMLGKRIKFRDFREFGRPVVTVERAVLHSALIGAMRNVRLMLGTTAEVISNSSEYARVRFSDGKEEDFDLVVAADGIHSGVREALFSSSTVPYGWSLRFFWLPAGIPVPSGALCLSKEKATLAMYPLDGRCFVGMYEYNPAGEQRLPFTVQDFLPYLLRHGWNQDHIDSLAREAAEGHQYYDHLRHIEMSDWFTGRVVLIGDARHGLSPITGMGGSMAIEDAFVLAEEIGRSQSLDRALKNYAARRDRRMKTVRSLARFSERPYFITSYLARVIRNGIRYLVPSGVVHYAFMRVIRRTLGQEL